MIEIRRQQCLTVSQAVAKYPVELGYRENVNRLIRRNKLVSKKLRVGGRKNFISEESILEYIKGLESEIAPDYYSRNIATYSKIKVEISREAFSYENANDKNPFIENLEDTTKFCEKYASDCCLIGTKSCPAYFGL